MFYKAEKSGSIAWLKQKERQGKSMEQLEQVKNMTTNWCEGTKGTLSNYFGKPVVRSRSQWITIGLLLFFVGIVIGFLCSPIKEGITIASNNENSFNNDQDEDD